MKRGSCSANTALMVLVFSAMCMALAIMGHSLWDAWEREKNAIETKTLAVVSAYQQQQFSLTRSTEVMLCAMSVAPLFKGGKSPALDDFLYRLDVTQPDYTGFAIFNLHGEALASVANGKDFDPTPPHIVREREYFKRALHSRSFSIGNSIPQHEDASKLYLPMSMPILGSHDRIRGVILAPLDMSQLAHTFSGPHQEALDLDATRVRMLDRVGRIMYQTPQNMTPPTGQVFASPCIQQGKNLPEDTVIRRKHSENTVEHICVLRKVYFKDEARPYMYIFAEAPMPSFWTFLTERYYLYPLAVLTSLLFALLVTRLVGWQFFGMGLQRLATVAYEAQQGKIDIRNGPLHGCREIQALGKGMDAMLDELQRLSCTDGLTGIWNRRRFDEISHTEMAHSLRHGYPLGIIMADVDYFKKINDQYGHQAGDEVLRRFAALLRGSVRATDAVARYGGEEFAVLLPHADTQAACRIAEKIRAATERLVVEYQSQQIRFTASFGVCSYTPPSDNTAHPQPLAAHMENLLRRADAALYMAKHAGRNRVLSCGEQHVA